MTPFYTRTGDDGMTSLLGKVRVKKNDLRIDTVGTLDEANAALGLARSLCGKPEWAELVITIQRDLYRMMSEVTATPENTHSFESITSENVFWLEDQIASLEAGTDIPRQFIIPGDNTSAAVLDVARVVVRRAERRATEMFHAGLIKNIHILEYLNRLSSFCFLLELATIQSNGKDTPTLAKTS